VFLGLGFLYADNIGIDFLEPVKKTFLGSGTDAIGVGRDNTHVCSSFYVAAYDT
jgi:hypothetical protein